MVTLIVASVVAVVSLVAGGYLHYRFGSRVKAVGEAVVGAAVQAAKQ